MHVYFQNIAGKTWGIEYKNDGRSWFITIIDIGEQFTSLRYN